MNQPTFRVVILLLLLSSTLTLVISLGGNYWLRTVEFNQGLWKECRPNEDCVDITTHNYEAVLHIVRFAIIGGLGFLLIGTCYFMAMTVQPKGFRSLYLSIFIGMAAIFIAIGASVYTYFNADNFTNAVQFEWSYYLCWCAFVLAVVTLGLTVHDARHLTPPYPNAERLH